MGFSDISNVWGKSKLECFAKPKNKFRLGQATENKPMVARVSVSFGHSKVNQGHGTTLVAFYFGD